MSEFKGKALIVEDEDDTRFIYRTHLKGFGLDVDEARNGVEGLDLLKKNTYDFILCDLRMPKMDGIDMLSEASKMDLKGAKIIVITATIAENYDQEKLEIYVS